MLLKKLQKLSVEKLWRTEKNNCVLQFKSDVGQYEQTDFWQHSWNEHYWAHDLLYVHWFHTAITDFKCSLQISCYFSVIWNNIISIGFLIMYKKFLNDLYNSFIKLKLRNRYYRESWLFCDWNSKNCFEQLDDWWAYQNGKNY